MGKIIIHKSLLDHIKIDGSFIDDKVKELEMASGIYDIVGGTDCDSSYNTEIYQHVSKSSITWGIHEKVKIDDKSVCHVHVKRKLSFLYIVPVIKVKYESNEVL